MHADVHLLLHDLRAAELHRAAADTQAHPLPHTPVRTQLGWALVELGLRLAVPGKPTTARPVTLAA
ncbi:hypothetical protein [Streptomyces sp. NPDC050848]|uniref:hypothetical protein n=1 Tax=Streptomyces sp. NPDC050848 TaxID=3155791 RepID=UPI003405BC52